MDVSITEAAFKAESERMQWGKKSPKRLKEIEENLDVSQVKEKMPTREKTETVMPQKEGPGCFMNKGMNVGP